MKSRRLAGYLLMGAIIGATTIIGVGVKAGLALSLVAAFAAGVWAEDAAESVLACLIVFVVCLAFALGTAAVKRTEGVHGIFPLALLISLSLSLPWIVGLPLGRLARYFFVRPPA